MANAALFGKPKGLVKNESNKSKIGPTPLFNRTQNRNKLLFIVWHFVQYPNMSYGLVISVTFHILQPHINITAGNHAIGTVRKFPTLPLNANGVWIDPTGGVWRQASTVANKDAIPDYAQVSNAPTLPLPDYER